jgi:hypothetical protein
MEYKLRYREKRVHRKKRFAEFPVPSRDVTTKLFLGGNNDVITELFLPRGSLVSDIPAGDGKLVNLFLQCGKWESCTSKNFAIEDFMPFIFYILHIKVEITS